MSALRSLGAGLRKLFRRDVVDSELDDELRHYLQQATAENLRAGMTPAAAERAARVQMGTLTGAREQALSGGWEASVSSVLQDIRYGLRTMRRSLGVTVVAAITLALGIGANTSMFSAINAVLLRPLPYRDDGRLVVIWTDDVRRSLHREATAYLTVTDWQAQNRTFRDMAYYSSQRMAPKANDRGGEKGRTRTALVSANLFSVLGVAPVRGRTLTADDERNRAPVAVVTYGFWRRWFNGDSTILGRTVTFDDDSKFGTGPLTIVGVMPEGFYFPDQATEVFAPATLYWRFQRESIERFPPWARRWTAVGRLNPGVDAAGAQADLDRIGRQLAATNATSERDFPGFATAVVPMLDVVTGTSIQSTLWLLLGAVSLVLLVACVNVANLLLARGAARQQEFAVRRAIGAGRGRLIRQLVAESLMLALAGGAGGVLIAAWGTKALGVAASAYVPRIGDITMDWRVLTFALLASVAAGLAFGITPALQLSAADATETLKEGGRGTGRVKLTRTRNLLVMAECALAIVLLSGAGLLLRSLNALASVPPGFDPSSVLTGRIEFPTEAPSGAADAYLLTSRSEPLRAAARVSMALDAMNRVRALPGVTSAGYVDDLFLNNQGNKSITIPGRTAEAMGAGELNDAAVSPGFFTTLRVPLKRGRMPTADDASQKIRALWQPITTHMSLADKQRLAVPEPVVVNEAFVRRFYPNEDPIGKKFCIDPTNKTYWYEIVGVVGDMRRWGLEKNVIPEYYGPWIPSPNGRVDLLVRTNGDPLALTASVRREVRTAISSATIVSFTTADAGLGGFSQLRRLQTSLLTIFALLALTLAAVGIFGLVHFAVAERTREIGVRVALGAKPSDVMGMVLGQGMRTPMIGIAIGIVASLALSRVMTNLLFGVGPTDPVTFAGVAIVLAAVAAGACWTAGRRALRVDPVRALRGA